MLFVLAELGEHAAPAVSTLMEQLEDKGKYVRGAAASALGTLGHAASVVPVLVKQLDDSRGEERSAAAHALDAIGLRVHVAPAILR